MQSGDTPEVEQTAAPGTRTGQIGGAAWADSLRPRRAPVTPPSDGGAAWPRPAVAPRGVLGGDGPEWRTALVGGLGAAAAAGAVMTLARTIAQVRTLPERMLEWLLLFIPLDVFGAALGRFGFEA